MQCDYAHDAYFIAIIYSIYTFNYSSKGNIEKDLIITKIYSNQL